jgi:type IV secretion system protein VirB2
MMSPFRLPARIAAVLALASAHTAAFAQNADPAGSGPINNALLWLQGTLMGTVATTVAVMAVAGIGFGMLTGRMNWRFGATVIIGIFIIFGATALVSGLRSFAG